MRSENDIVIKRGEDLVLLSASIWQVFSSDWRCYTFANKCSWLLFTFLSWFWSCAPVHTRPGGAAAVKLEECALAAAVQQWWKTSGEWMEHSTESQICKINPFLGCFCPFQKLVDFCHRFRLILSTKIIAIANIRLNHALYLGVFRPFLKSFWKYANTLSVFIFWMFVNHKELKMKIEIQFFFNLRKSCLHGQKRSRHLPKRIVRIGIQCGIFLNQFYSDFELMYVLQYTVVCMYEDEWDYV